MAEPKYVEILSQLRTRCADLAVGSKLSSERALAAEFGVSAMTIRQSLSKLGEEGWIRRTRGSGTYVSRPVVAMGPSLTSLTEDLRRLGLTPGAKVLRFEPVIPDLETTTILALRPNEQAVVLERLRTADGEPLCHEISVYPARLKQILSAADLTRSVHETLAAEGVVPYSTFRRVRAVVASPNESALLELPAGAPALEIVDTFSDALGEVVQHVRSRYRFDRYEVVSNIVRLPHPLND
ncbi:GntR family transcriptional regulator [Microbacterium luteolum]|jgi:GntR family transcriptional regulator|uniref:GntR family transcriptional regulator n=1 Tax=Microbacterium luteolum TaxID=69367 RepID=A0ABY7XQU1_MICLT|nr:GntR family transcriptional regulator [Microbacterium luteolum]WDM44469.1 GntR family transcriptional regulator [Microbacterium luteolum]